MLNIGGVQLKNSVITSSGTCGFGKELNEYFPINELGAICVKGITLKKKDGNKAPRICETPSGIMNSVGLQNPGVKVYIEQALPFLKSIGATVIANINGSTIDEYVEMARIVSESDSDIIELNISCPNVKQGGAAFGTNEAILDEVTRKVRAASTKPLIVKLSPNVTDIGVMAKIAEDNGADAISLINTVMGMKIDINTGKPFFENKVAGLSGAAIMPIAVRMVWQARRAVKIPIIGMGGIMNYLDALEFIMAGANAVSIGTASLINPNAAYDIKNDLEKYLKARALSDISSLVGLAQV